MPVKPICVMVRKWQCITSAMRWQEIVSRWTLPPAANASIRRSVATLAGAQRWPWRSLTNSAVKAVAAPLKLDLAQYRALAAFAQFASDLDKATRDQLTRGEKLSEIIKQPQFQPLPVEKQVAILYVATTGKLDDVPTPRVKEFETQFYRFLETERADILTELAEKKEMTDEMAKAIDEAIETFRVEVFGMDAAKPAARKADAPAPASISSTPAPAAAAADAVNPAAVADPDDAKPDEADTDTTSPTTDDAPPAAKDDTEK